MFNETIEITKWLLFMMILYNLFLTGVLFYIVHFAALNAGLFFLAFFFALFLMTGWERLFVSLLVLACWMFFAVYTFIRIKQTETEEDAYELL